MYIRSYQPTNAGWTQVVAPGRICGFAIRALDCDITIAENTADLTKQDTLYKGEQEAMQSAKPIYESGQTIIWIQTTNGYASGNVKLYAIPANFRQ